MSLAGTTSRIHIRTKRKFWGWWHVIKGFTPIAVSAVICGTLIYNMMPVVGWWSLLFLILILPSAIWGGNEIGIGSKLLAPPFTDAPGTASVGTAKHLKEHDLLTPGLDKIYCGMNKNRAVYYGGDQHIVTLGPTRVGKDTGLLVPNLLRLNRSVMVIDPKGEAAAITAKYRATLGPVIVINPFFEEFEDWNTTHPHLRSSGFNPLAELNVSASNFFDQAAILGDSLIKVDSEREKHWALRAQALITTLIMKAAWDKGTMRNVSDMLSAPYTSPDSSQVTLQQIAMAIGNHKDEEMAKLAKGFISSNPKEIEDVVSTARGQTRCINSKLLLADMAKHPMIDGKPFHFGMLKKRVITVYVILPPDKLSSHSIWFRLLVSIAINALKRGGQSGRVNPVLMLNEAGNLGYLEPLESSMGVAAGLGMTIWTAWQSLSQISKIYGDHGKETFLANAGVLNLFRTGDLETSDYISRLMGKKTVAVMSYGASQGITNQSESPMGFPLFHPEDLTNMKKGALISRIYPSAKPYMLNAPGYWDIPEVAKRADPNPYYLAANGKAS